MPKAKLLPDSLNDPDRFEKVARTHLNAIAWQPQGYIPLGVIVQDPAHNEGISYDQWLDSEIFFEAQAKILRDTLVVGSDYLPVLPMLHVGDVLIPTMFGAELYVPTAMAATLQDQGPTPMSVLHDIKQVDDLTLPGMTAGLMPEFVDTLRTWRDLAPDWVEVLTPSAMGPFSLASELRGSDLFLDLVEDPQRCHRLLDICAEMQIRTELYMRGTIDEPRTLPISNFGVRSQGRRLGDDVIINLSPAMIAEFVVTHIETVAKALGPATVHFCTLPEHRADHVFEPLAGSSYIQMASSQFAFEYYDAHLDKLRGRLAIESFYGDAYEYICEKHGSFRDWAFDFVPRFRNESGLILYFWVPSLELGEELWATWQEAHRRH